MKSVFSDQYSLMIKALVSARKACDLTQTELAERLRKPQSFVSKYERCERRLDVVELIEIARYLKLDPHLIIDEIESFERSA
ncbi:helix-turn-helix domain-containing protein [Thalassospira sp.]|uniref:helix-turn-helix domain-containing protein n=1 Tax=Thalassospira sp. TaxID=1912094 RepID=UPI003AA926D3